MVFEVSPVAVKIALELPVFSQSDGLITPILKPTFVALKGTSTKLVFFI